MTEVRSSIARRLGIETAGLVSTSRYVDGIVEMLMDATQHYGAPLSDERLFGWHNVLFPTGRSGLYAIEVGKYRTGEMQVVSGPMGHETVDKCQLFIWHILYSIKFVKIHYFSETDTHQCIFIAHIRPQGYSK